MKKSPEEHAARFDEKAATYDDERPAEYVACLSLVIDHARARLREDDVVLDLGTGTGAVALSLADDAAQVVGRDISEGMLERARENAEAQSIQNVSFDVGRFRNPNYDGPADVVVSNFAMHHLTDEEKREALQVAADLGARLFVLGDVMLFGQADPSVAFFDPAVDDPATVGVLADAFTDAGFVLTAVDPVHEQVGVLVGERAIPTDEPTDQDETTGAI